MIEMNEGNASSSQVRAVVLRVSAWLRETPSPYPICLHPLEGLYKEPGSFYSRSEIKTQKKCRDPFQHAELNLRLTLSTNIRSEDGKDSAEIVRLCDQSSSLNILRTFCSASWTVDADIHGPAQTEQMLKSNNPAPR
ncbi:unnamed protein product [Boreogadus saida]